MRPSDGSSGVGGVWCGGVCVFVLLVWCGVMVWVVVCAEKNFEKCFVCSVVYIEDNAPYYPASPPKCDA